MAYLAPAGVRQGASADTDAGREPEEDTVPVHAVRPLEPFEVKSEGVWQVAFQDDFYATVAELKEGANTLFKIKDYDAAIAYYGIAIDKLRDLRTSDLSTVMLIHGGTLVPGRVGTLNSKSQKATVTIQQPCSSQSHEVSVPVRTLIPAHERHLVLQGSLYMNRARSLTQLERNQEAAQDLSVVICLWDMCGTGTERQEQLTKAYYLRAKTRLSRMKIEPTRADVRAAWSLEPPEATAKLLRQLEREVSLAEKEKIRSNKDRERNREVRRRRDVATGRLSARGAETDAARVAVASVAHALPVVSV